MHKYAVTGFEISRTYRKKLKEHGCNSENITVTEKSIDIDVDVVRR